MFAQNGGSMNDTVMEKARSREEERVVMAGSEGDSAQASKFTRRLPIGAELQPRGGVHFRIWAPGKQRVAVQVTGSAGKTASPIALKAEGNGYHSALVSDAKAGNRYWYTIDD